MRRHLLPTSLLLCAVISLGQHVSATSSDSQSDSDDPQCTWLPPPHQPFRVVWNHPDSCDRMGIHLNLSDYGIIFNEGHQFIGNEIQTLYHTGLWPTYSHGVPVNGGLPQLVNDTTFAQTRVDLGQHKISGFTGLGVLDFEAWRLIFSTNWGSMTVYKKESVHLARQRHPELNDSMANHVAVQEWEAGAGRLMLAKLAIGQEIMPRGHWGYYGYPRAWPGLNVNDRVDWFWRKATGLFPRIYLQNPNQTEASKMESVVKQVTEAVRIQHTFSPPNTVIYPYSLIEYGSYNFFNEDNLNITLAIPADMGASGVVLWGSSSLYRVHGQCNRVQQYVHDVLGPYVQTLTQFMSDCSAAVCGGHGRCVHNSRDTLIDAIQSEKLSALCTARDSRFQDYHCRCYSSWSGPCCDTQTPLPCREEPLVGK